MPYVQFTQCTYILVTTKCSTWNTSQFCNFRLVRRRVAQVLGGCLQSQVANQPQQRVRVQAEGARRLNVVAVGLLHGLQDELLLAVFHSAVEPRAYGRRGRSGLRTRLE